MSELHAAVAVQLQGLLADLDAPEGRPADVDALLETASRTLDVLDGRDELVRPGPRRLNRCASPSRP
jgi:hypothetical protein